MTKWDLPQRCKFGLTPEIQLIPIIHHVRIFKNSHAHLNRQKQNPTPFHFMIKTLNKLGIDWTSLNLINDIYEKPTGNVTPNAFLLRSGTGRGCPPWRLSILFTYYRNTISILLNTVLELLSRTIWQEKEIKGIQIRKWSETTSACGWHDLTHRKP